MVGAPARRKRNEIEEETVIVIDGEFVTLNTPNGPMRTHIVRPVPPGRYPGIVFYSEIFQITAPIRRMAAFFAGHGYIVATPEIYHEFEPAGTVFAYDQAGSDRGNTLKTTKKLSSYDADARAALDHLAARPDCTGKLGALGICIGGHLAFRAAMNPDVLGTACFYATDIHKGGLGEGMHDDSLERAKDIHGELLMIWGRQDPHIPLEGRTKVLARLNELGLRLNWIEVNGAHAFMRDEGPRYDPELAYNLYDTVLAFFHRKLGQGDLPIATAGAAETRH
jgi:carboxymethylenebutenolidase